MKQPDEKSVLIICPELNLSNVLKRRCELARYKTDIATSASDALSKLDGLARDVVALDIATHVSAELAQNPLIQQYTRDFLESFRKGDGYSGLVLVPVARGLNPRPAKIIVMSDRGDTSDLDIIDSCKLDQFDPQYIAQPFDWQDFQRLMI